MTREPLLNSGDAIEGDLEESVAGSRDEDKVPGVGDVQRLELFDRKADGSEEDPWEFECLSALEIIGFRSRLIRKTCLVRLRVVFIRWNAILLDAAGLTQHTQNNR